MQGFWRPWEHLLLVQPYQILGLPGWTSHAARICPGLTRNFGDVEGCGTF